MVDVPNPGGGDPLRLPQLHAGVSVLGGGGDPADIGSSPQQVVDVHVVEEKPL